VEFEFKNTINVNTPKMKYLSISLISANSNEENYKTDGNNNRSK
jgi:hypothetical protein